MNTNDSANDGQEIVAKPEKNWKRFLKPAFLVLVAVFLVRYFVKNYGSYRNLDIIIQWGVFLAAMGIHFVYKITLVMLWHYITKLNHCAIKPLNAAFAYLYSILGKYIPGKVFMLLARIPPYEKEGVPPRKVTVCFFLENMCTLLGAAFLFLISLLFFPNDLLQNYQWAVLIFVAAFIVCIHPRILNFFLRLVEKVLKKDVQISMSYREMLSVVGLFVVNWAVLGVGFYMLTCSIYPLPASQMLYVSGVFGLSVIIGILAIFAPSGIGVREGIIVLGLSIVMPNEYAVIISVVSRLWMTVSELSVVAVAWVADRFRQHRKKAIAGAAVRQDKDETESAED